uniref:Midgut cathepsin D-like protein CatD8 n=1 Tax=Dysdercus peruvianus TaxID=685034 RepID=A0A1J0KIS3_9HEMI|nr:midgut cathepsin D-like protein CatD8 [Dysdercus peruvianus]
MFCKSLFVLSVLASVQVYAQVTVQLYRNTISDLIQNAHSHPAKIDTTERVNGLNFNLLAYWYYSTISVGSNKQKLNVSFATEDESIYIPTGGDKNVTTFNPSESSSFIRTTTKIPNVHCNVSMYGNDTVQIGNLSAASQPLALYEVGTCMNILNGSVGLGFTVENQLPTFVDNLFLQGKIKKQVVGLHLNRDWKSHFAGEISIGHLDTRLVDDNIKYIKATPVVPYWSVTLNIVKFNDVLIATNVEAVLSSYLAFILLPNDNFRTVSKLMKGSILVDGFLLIDKSSVDKLPALEITVSENKYTLSPKDYVDTVHDFNGLNLILLGSTEDSKWQIGGSFLGKYYMELDYQNRRIGFSELKSSGGPSRSGLFVPLLLITALINVM